MINGRLGRRSWRRFLGGSGEEVAVIRMRRQKRSGEGGGRAWSKGNNDRRQGCE